MSNIKSSKLWWLNEESLTMLKRGYLLPDQTVEEKLEIICKRASDILGRPDLKDKFKEVFERGWASLSSPIWANFGEDRGLPISCFSSKVEDNLDHIFSTVYDVAMMTKMGGGTAGDFSDIRPIGSKVSRGGEASGAMSFIEIFDATIKNVSQSGVRKGGFAAYMDVNHPEILELIRIKDRDSSMQSINTAVNVDDKFMEEMIAGDSDKRKVWAEILRSRREKGIPYLFFKDTVNRGKPDVYKDKNLEIKHGNLCNEVLLPTNAEESLVCCLLSMNLYLYDEWKNTDSVELMVYFLDAVMTDFIEKAKGVNGMERAVRFAERHRALGLGVLGFHSLLQSRNISFESLEAQYLNHEIFSLLKENAYKASEDLAKEYGEPEVLKGYGRRNTTLLAVAPTTSSASILGQVSPSVEPYKSNYYKAVLAKGSFERINKPLSKLLKSKGKDTDEVWNSIIFNRGSVQHLDFLTEHEKNVFKTFSEINPDVIIRLASQRQKYICQGQSINLDLPEDLPVKELNRIHIEAWKQGLKGLYYQRGTSVTKKQMAKLMECVSCSA